MCQSHHARQYNGGMTKINVEDAIGTRLAHDITEIRPGEFKGPAFRRGHKVQERDVCRLMRLGKRHLYILDLKADQVHEDDAVVELATALAGPGVTFELAPREGKLQLQAAYTGLLKVKTDALVAFNLIPDVMCAAMHGNVPVSRGQIVAGTRAIPLVIEREVLDQAVALALEQAPIFSVKAYHRKRVRLIITGNEVYEGMIDDRFEAIVRNKLAYKGNLPIVGIPACGLFHKITFFDLVLPRLLAGETLDERDLARFAVGGLCLDCPECRYPACPMGKTGC
jgi:hypothetical protein